MWGAYGMALGEWLDVEEREDLGGFIELFVCGAID